jgi:Uma2 family endonuclease
MSVHNGRSGLIFQYYSFKARLTRFNDGGEMHPDRPLPEYELRGADVAFVSQQRWDATDDDDNLHGSPDLVIEVLSPSNTKAEIHDKAVLCLSTGTLQFWVLDPKRNTISVTPQGNEPVLYRTGDRIPLPLFGGELDVAEFFG